jgi:hypothetical protein
MNESAWGQNSCCEKKLNWQNISFVTLWWCFLHSKSFYVGDKQAKIY